MQMFDHPDYVKAVVGFCASVGRKAAQAYLENGADVIAVVDPMTSQISAAHFQEFCTPPLNELFNFIREKHGLLLALRLRGRLPQPRSHGRDRLRQHVH